MDADGLIATPPRPTCFLPYYQILLESHNNCFDQPAFAGEELL
jgi:hypothetical protein